MDTNSHCRSVDDIKLLTKKPLAAALSRETTREHCEPDSVTHCDACPTDSTRVKTAGVTDTTSSSLQTTSTSLQPLLNHHHHHDAAAGIE